MTSNDTAPSEPIDPDLYAAFIQQIELRDLWLDRASITNGIGPTLQDAVTVTIHPEASRWEATPEGFRAFRAYAVDIWTADNQRAGEISATFGAEFSSAQAMTDDLFTVFADVNLYINTWPYLREFVHSAGGRMGWSPLTLPAVKVGTPAPVAPASPLPARQTRARRPKAEKAAVAEAESPD
ncbi:MAG: hypothetical protein QM692_10085 [Thermomicrobiales bacterium]